MQTLTIVVPTFQEAGNIENFLRHVEAISARDKDFLFEVMVIDDSSPDGTAEIARQVAASFENANFRVRVEVRAEKEGLGAAYVWAFLKLLYQDAPPDYILQMDADLSHDPKYIPALLDAVRGGADLVVASRYIPGGATPDWTWKRKLLSVGGNLYARALLGSKITDHTGGFNLYESNLLRRADPSSIKAKGYGFQIELKYRATRLAEKIREVPIVFLDRTEGESKIPSDTLLKSLWLVVQLRRGRQL